MATIKKPSASAFLANGTSRTDIISAREHSTLIATYAESIRPLFNPFFWIVIRRTAKCKIYIVFWFRHQVTLFVACIVILQRRLINRARQCFENAAFIF